MMCKVKVVLLTVLGAFVNFTVSDGTKTTYAQEVTRLLVYFFESSSNGCLVTAKEKVALNWIDTWTEDENMAMILINIYTQECLNFKDNLEKKSFYATLNKNLRSGQPLPIWMQTAKLLSIGLRHFGIEHFPDVYRGSHCDDIQEGSVFSFKQFASTSLDPEIGFLFLQPGKCFFHILNAQGTAISQFAYIDDDEILIRPETQFYVEKVENDNDLIQVEIKALLADTDTLTEIETGSDQGTEADTTVTMDTSKAEVPNHVDMITYTDTDSEPENISKVEVLKGVRKFIRLNGNQTIVQIKLENNKEIKD